MGGGGRGAESKKYDPGLGHLLSMRKINTFIHDPIF